VNGFWGQVTSDQFVDVTNSGDNTISPFRFSLASPYLTPISWVRRQQ
jgi:hypothetical protein